MKTLAQAVTTRTDATKPPALFVWGPRFLDTIPAVPGTMVIVGGRTGHGKSFFGLELLRSTETPALYISCEDPESEVARRAIGMPLARLQEILLVVPRRPRLSAVVRAIETAFAEGHLPRLVMLDYIQLVQYDGEVAAWSQTDAIGMIISELKALGRELGFVLVLNAQLNRPKERAYADDFPNLWDLRDSANLENAAEAVILLHGPGDIVEVRVCKNKSGRNGNHARFSRGPNGFFLPVSPAPDPDIFGDGEVTYVPAAALAADDLFAEAA